jgi:hypothetical protein
MLDRRETPLGHACNGLKRTEKAAGAIVGMDMKALA